MLLCGGWHQVVVISLLCFSPRPAVTGYVAQTRNKVLLSAFTRALRDPFPPARLASVRAMLACVEYFKDDDIAVRLLPAICPLMVDKEKPVREAVSEWCEH